MRFLKTLLLILTLLVSETFIRTLSATIDPIISNQNTKEVAERPAFNSNNKWVDSLYYTLNDSQKIGQLFMVAAYSNQPISSELNNLVSKFHIGGLIYMKGTPHVQVAQTNHYQRLAKIPLLISMDAEYGLAMRLDSTLKFPNQLTMGALKNNGLIEQMGFSMSEQLRALGVHVSFSPVVDVNNNPNNPVINFRSFGDDKHKVSQKAASYMFGLQTGKVIACAKHFPGHGDTNTDSHYALPQMNQTEERLDSIELYPFRQLIKNGVASIMVAHLDIPALDKTPNLPSTLSSKIVDELLKQKMAYDGLIFTDALNMKGVADLYEPGESDLKAFLAGNDMLLFPLDVPKSFKKFFEAKKAGLITEKRLEESVKKILAAKYWVGLHNYQPINTTNLNRLLSSTKYLNQIQTIYEQAFTLVQDQNDLLPLKLNTAKVAYLEVGGKPGNQLAATLNNHLLIDSFSVSWNASEADLNALKTKLLEYKLVVTSFHLSSQYKRGNFGITNNLIRFASELEDTIQQIVVVHGNPYSLENFAWAKTLCVAYEDHPLAHKAAANALVGASNISGRLPVSASIAFTSGTGIEKYGIGLLKPAFPEAAGLRGDKLREIDAIVANAIEKGAFPGCQVYVSVGNKIVYNKSFGQLTYDKNALPVSQNTLYDIASITKIASSTMAVMKLVEQEKLNLNAPIINYLPELRYTDKADITLLQILTHTAGLHPYLPIWQKTFSTDKKSRVGISPTQSDTFNFRISDNLYLLPSFEDTIFQEILQRPLENKGEYKYSDLGYTLIKRIVERITQTTLDQYVEDNFYKPLGLNYLLYKPLQKFPKNQIAPTENDLLFRKSLVHGDVHDQTAALLNGVGGHAGLFSNATDLGKLMYMLLCGGYYNGNEFLMEDVISTFTTAPLPEVRRGIGFDKPETNPMKITPTSAYASPQTFGHTGFTGTCTWVDPEKRIVYVFLSNRVYPDAENKRITEMGIRSLILDKVYEAFITN